MRKKFVHFLWSLILFGTAFCVFMFILIWNGWIGYMPDMKELQNPIDRYATQVYSADGKVIGTWNMDKQNRIRVGFNKINPNVVQALVATEDERYYEHSGVDFVALGRAIVKRGIMGQTNAGGGSTITQQLAKQLYSEKAGSTFERLMQKPIEWVIAIKLERNFTKEEIVTMYLNQFDFLHNAVGIKNAANTYFSKEPENLSLEEAAMLIGLCKNPSYFNPVRHEERCLERRNVVLQQMLKAGYITESQYNEVSAKPIELHFHRADHKEGVAPYLREFLRQYMMMERPDMRNYPSWQHVQYVIDSINYAQDPLCGWCKKNFKKDGTPYNIYKDGLKVFTTIDTRMQEYAEEAVYAHVARYLQPNFNRQNRYKVNAPFSGNLTAAEVQRILNRSITQSDRYRTMKAAGYSDEEIRASFHKKTEMTVFTYHGDKDTMMTPLDSIRYYKSFLRSGFCSMDAKTGAVKAYVGGLNFANFQYDMVTGGRRQVGSTIKPYLYALAMENGMTPCDGLPNASAFSDWHVKGASGAYRSLRSALQHSLNGTSTQLMKRFSPDGRAFMDFLNTFGIHLPDVYPTKTLCLGSCDINVIEMVSAYTAFVNHGIRCAPLFVTRIEDSNGQVIAKFEPRMNEVLSEEASYKMLDLLKGVVDGGTGSRMRFKYNVDAEMGAKTGTTNNNSDGWFMAITPELASGCWVGGEDRDIHFDSEAWGQGATMALPVYAYYIKKVYADSSLPYRSDAKFDVPEDFNPCQREDTSDDFMDIEDVYE